MAEHAGCASQLARKDTQRRRRYMPLAHAPEPWLQLLVNDEDLLGEKSLQNLMCASWAICRVVLRCMRRWWLKVPVRDT
jgi:hypothetical protein